MSFTVKAIKAYPSKNVGGSEQPYTPMIGEPYRITVEYEVFGTPTMKYMVGFTVANQSKSVVQQNLSSGLHKLSCQFDDVPLDDPIPYEISLVTALLPPPKVPTPAQPSGGGKGGGMVGKFDPNIVVASDPQGSAQDKTIKGVFTPQPPSKAIDHYSPKTYIGTQSVEVKFKDASKSDRVALMMGPPTTDGWQKVTKSFCKITSALDDETLTAQPVANDSFYPVYYWRKNKVALKRIFMVQQFGVELSNQRVNADKLRTVTWAKLDAAKALNHYRFYTEPEAVIESTHAKIVKFAKDTLGANFRDKMKPYDAARKLFKAVLKHVKYTYPKEGEVDQRGHTAVAVLEKGKGDCGGFSLLLVALFRHIGIASRIACGIWKGQDSGHCWCELWFPTKGWMVADGSAGNAMAGDGEFAYYFGNIPNLNSRVALIRGNTFALQGDSASWLPTIFTNAAFKTYTLHTWMGDPAGMDALIAPGPPKAAPQPLIQTPCPCGGHGGSGPGLHVKKINVSK